MADLRLRINELPEELNPAAIDNIAIDGPSTRRTTAAALANATRPYATEPQAREGLSDVSVMSPLRVNQAIETLGGQRFATSDQGNKANTAVQPTLTLTAGAGLTGGGTLAANRTFALSTTALASLALADSAVQTINGKSGSLIVLNADDVGAVPIARDAEIIANTAARHNHVNKAILDAVTAAFTTVLKAKLDGIPADADKTPALAAVAISGSYNDLSNKPSIPAAQVQTDWNASTGIAAIANKPASFPPSPHNHADATTAVAGFMSAVDKSKINGMAEGATANTGTVTSVAVSVPTGLNVASSPVTTSGTIAINYASGYQGFTTVQANKLAGIPADADKTPALATVATSGAYNDLTGKPTIPPAQIQPDWNATSGLASIANKPTLTAVATSGDYNDLIGKPTIPAAQVQSDWNASTGVAAILNKPVLGSLAAKSSVGIADISATGTPSTVTFLRGDNVWATPPGGGGGGQVNDVIAGTGVSVDRTDPINPQVSIATETLAAINANTADRHNHPNKAVLDTTTASFTTALKNKLEGIPADADKTPSLATVATTGNYSDLVGKPTIPAAQVQTDWNSTNGLASIANKPAEFPPSSHTHVPSQVGLGNVANKSEAQMVASGAISDAIASKISAAGQKGLGGFSGNVVDVTGSTSLNTTTGSYINLTNSGNLVISANTEAGGDSYLVLITNVTGAGTVTFAGMTATGDTLTSTVGDKFFVSVGRIGSDVLAVVTKKA